MLTHYLTLGLKTEADDEAIRGQYLALVKAHPPESDPEMFRRITEAYEAIRDERRRIAWALFGILRLPDYEDALTRLATAGKNDRRRVGLKDLMHIQNRIS